MSRCAVLLLAALFVAGTSAQAIYPTLGDAVKTVKNEYTIFQAALAAVKLTDVLKLSNVTVFIPSDAAFNRTLTALNITAEDILANTNELVNVLTYHVVVGKSFATQAQLIAARNLTALNGQTLKINSSSSGAVILGALTSANVTGFSGLLGNSSANATGSFYTIDAVLLPKPAATNASAGTPAKETTQTPTTGSITTTASPPTVVTTRNSAASAAFSLAAVAAVVLAALL